MGPMPTFVSPMATKRRGAPLGFAVQKRPARERSAESA